MHCLHTLLSLLDCCLQGQLEELGQKLRAARQEAKAAQERAHAAVQSRKEQAASDQLRLQVPVLLCCLLMSLQPPRFQKALQESAETKQAAPC